MAHLIALIMVVGLSGMPAGSLLCGLSCAPEEATAPSCHEHGGTPDDTTTMKGVHLCDQDASTVPMIASASFSSAVVDFTPPHIQLRLSLPHVVAINRPWTLPPGAPSGRLGVSQAILRI
jgi:hypothetical protein